MTPTDPTAAGTEVNEYVGLEAIQTGNSDLVCERAEPTPDTRTCTLPIYPLPSDFESAFQSVFGAPPCQGVSKR